MTIHYMWRKFTIALVETIPQRFQLELLPPAHQINHMTHPFLLTDASHERMIILIVPI